MKKSIILNITVQGSVTPLTTGCCPLSQNKLEQLTTTLSESNNNNNNNDNNNNNNKRQ